MSQLSLTNLRSVVKGLIQARAYFTGIPILTEDQDDYDDAVESAMMEQGICVIVLRSHAGGAGHHSRRVVMTPQFAVNVRENPKANATGKDAEAVLERVIQAVISHPDISVSSSGYGRNPEEIGVFSIYIDFTVRGIPLLHSEPEGGE